MHLDRQGNSADDWTSALGSSLSQILLERKEKRRFERQCLNPYPRLLPIKTTGRKYPYDRITRRRAAVWQSWNPTFTDESWGT